ncbi:MAG: heavy-metal-associated domain-containing protein [Gammaproteobacteria bacterium]|nr:heavy-metal-associated domain-containing protein [Gammaproteobacteria bacterium]NNJ90712.1 heavy-metal-associated domain-containing protein [Gammaproteobacteria bacterium]
MDHYRSNILIHIGESLDDNNIHQLEKQISFSPGIYSACVNEKARHLMLIDYDPGTVRASEILSHIQQSGLHAELIGL